MAKGKDLSRRVSAIHYGGRLKQRKPRRITGVEEADQSKPWGDQDGSLLRCAKGTNEKKVLSKNVNKCSRPQTWVRKGGIVESEEMREDNRLCEDSILRQVEFSVERSARHSRPNGLTARKYLMFLSMVSF